MSTILILALGGVQVALALFEPVALIYLSLLTGPVPISLGREGMLASDFGKMDLSAIRLLGLWFASALVVGLHLGRGLKYATNYPFHLCFLALAVVSLAWAPSLAYGARMIAKLSAPLLFMLLIMVAVGDERRFKTMERLYLIGGGATIVVAALSYLAGVTRDAVGFTIPSTTPALFSAYLVVVAMVVFARLNTSAGSKAADGLMLLFLAAGILAAFTRITIGALFMGMSAMLWWSARGMFRYLLPVAGVFGLAALFVVSDTFRNRMFFDSGSITLMTLFEDPAAVFSRVHGSGRYEAWGIVLDKFFSPNPLFGSGIGATQHYFYSQLGGGIGVIHSEFVRLASEVGVVGLMLFLLAIVAYLWRLAGLYRQAPRSPSGRYALAGFAGLVVYLTFMATDNAFDYFNGFGMYVFALVGMSEKARELELAESEKEIVTTVHSEVPVGFEVTAQQAVKPHRRRYPLLGEA